MNKASKIQCLAPWIEAQVFSDLRMAPCCITNEAYARPLKSGDFMADWNSDAAQDVRSRFFAGARCVECGKRAHPELYRQMGRYPSFFGPGKFADMRRGRGPREEFVKELRIRKEEVEAGATKLALPPLCVRLAPAFRCNFQCIMCNQPRGEKRLPDTPSAYLDFVLDEHRHIARIAVAGGEPFANATARKLLARTAERQCDFSVTLATNGSLLDFDILQALNMRNSLISFHGATAATYEKIQRGGDFYHTLRNIIHYKELLRCGKISGRLNINSVITTENVSEMPDLVRMFDRLDIPLHFAYGILWRDQAELDLASQEAAKKDEILKFIRSALTLAKGGTAQSIRDVEAHFLRAKSLREAPSPA